MEIREKLKNSTRVITAILSLAVIFTNGAYLASAQGTDDDVKLVGRLGGTIADIQDRFGTPSWTDAGLIGYNSVALNDVPTILVVYYDEQESVNNLTLVYNEKPAEFSDIAPLQDAVAEVLPQDASCNASVLTTSSFGSDVYGCKSAALGEMHPDWALSNAPGSLSFSVDPTQDQYYEIVVQPGTGVETTTTNSGGSSAASTAGQTSSADTSTTDFTADESTYATQVYLQTQMMADSLGRFSDLMQSPAAFTDSWIIDVASELALWRQVYQEALAITPPPRFASIHAKYLEGLSYYDQATDEIAYGIDHLDPDAINRATALMTLGNAAIIEASNEIDALAS